VLKAFCLVFVLFVLCLQFGCGIAQEDLENALVTTDRGAAFGVGYGSVTSSGDCSHTVDAFASDLVVASTTDVLNDSVDESLSVSSLLFCVEDQTVLYQNNIFAKLNPASTTKILTAYTALKHASLDTVITVSSNALNLVSGSSVAGFSVGDTISLNNCLYGLMLPSGNDAATAIAESISGSVDTYAELMNEEARSLGATSTHYVNAHGLSDNDHYTTAYDLYLMFWEALQNDTFYTVITTPTYTCTYFDADGVAQTAEWSTTNYYLLDKAEIPSGVTVLGGKTGTTEEAGSCLVLASSYNGKTYISVVLGAPSKDILYKQMTQILYLIVN